MINIFAVKLLDYLREQLFIWLMYYYIFFLIENKQTICNINIKLIHKISSLNTAWNYKWYITFCDCICKISMLHLYQLLSIFTQLVFSVYFSEFYVY